MSYKLYNSNPGVDPDIMTDSECGSLVIDWDHVSQWNPTPQIVEWKEASFEGENGYLLESFIESDELVGTYQVPLKVSLEGSNEVLQTFYIEI